MKPRYIIFLSFVLLLIVSCFYYSHKKQATLFDKQIIDAVHLPQINPLFEKADAYKYAQDYRKADDKFKGLLQKQLSTADSQYILNQLAYINLTINEDSVAEHWIRQIEKTSHPLSITAQADYNYNVGTWAYHTFKPKMAQEYLKKALESYQKVYGNEHLKTALCLTQLGMMHYQFANNCIDSAKMYLNLAGNIYQSSISVKNYSTEWALGMSYLAYIKWENDKALIHINNALDILEHKNRQKEIIYALCLSWKSLIVKKEGDMGSNVKKKKYEQADSISKKAIEIGQVTQSTLMQLVYRNAVILKSRLNDSISCQLYLEKLSQLLLKQPDYYAKPERLKGFYYYSSGDTMRAKYWYRCFWENHIIDSCRNSFLLAEASGYLQFYYAALPNYDSALYFLKQNIVSITTDQGKDLPWSSLLSPDFYEKNKHAVVSFPIASRIFNSKYEAQKDLKSLKQAFEIISFTDSLLFESIFSSDDETLLSYQKEYGEEDNAFAIQTSYLLYRATKESKYIELGFKLSERFKSVLLFRNIVNSEVESGQKAIIDSIRSIKSKINILKSTGKESLEKLDLITKLDLLSEQLEKQNPVYYKSKVLQPIPSLKETQALINPSQILINYSLTENKIYRILISKEHCDFQAFEGIDTLKHDLKQVRSLLTSQDMSSSSKVYKELGSKLYEKLLGKMSYIFKNKKELIIIPDRILSLLPFEALVQPNINTDTTFDKLPYAIHKYSFTYTSSFKVYKNNLKALLPLSPKVAAFSYDTMTLELPYFSKELLAITGAYGDKLSTFLGKECTKKTFLDALKSFDIIHLALHASSNPAKREDNRIFFEPKNKGILNDLDLENYQSRAKILVLSACQTAEGKVEVGEGIYSLSRAFLQIGISNVIGSLWKIDDASTSEIISSFYKKLAISSNSSEALNTAKKTYLKSANKQSAHPKYWAGLLNYR